MKKFLFILILIFQPLLFLEANANNIQNIKNGPQPNRNVQSAVHKWLLDNGIIRDIETDDYVDINYFYIGRGTWQVELEWNISDVYDAETLIIKNNGTIVTPL